MAVKLNQNGPYLEFHCPGCGEDHAVNGRWTWNSSFIRPSFQPSVKYESAKGICHFYVTDGKIQFCTDCTAHKLGGQTVDLLDWDREPETDSQGTFEVESSTFPETEEKTMAEKKEFTHGDQVKLLAPHLLGIAAEVCDRLPNSNNYVCRITSSEHPSGHSQEGTLVMFAADQLETADVPDKKEVSL